MKTWVISANPAVYNHEKAFLEQGYIDWRQTRNFAEGDIIYVYCTRPLSKVMYKVEVVSTNSTPPEEQYWLTEHSLPANARYMRLRLLKKLDSASLSLSNLQEHGLHYAPQSPCVAKDELRSYLNEQFGDECDE